MQKLDQIPLIVRQFNKLCQYLEQFIQLMKYTNRIVNIHMIKYTNIIYYIQLIVYK